MGTWRGSRSTSGTTDPEILLTYAAESLDRVEPIDIELVRARRGRGAAVAATVFPRLAGAMASMSEPVVLVLDHVELLWNQQCLDAIAELAVHLPTGSQLAFATRGRPPFPIHRLRAAGDIVEVGVNDLAMSESEARALLDAVGVRLAEVDLRRLLERTEGWPVGLYLAALAMRAGCPERSAGVRFSGDDRLMADYMRSELLSRLSEDEVSFLTRTSVLDRMCGPLCDAVIGTEGSADVLESLERSNLLLVALDRKGEWYRYHQLFRDLLGAELRRRERDVVPELHRRAASWFEANRLPEIAIDHAREAGDAGRFTDLVLRLIQPVWANGHVDTILGWMEWLDDQDLVDTYPAVAIHGALIFALLGQPIEAERWAAAAESAPPTGTLADGSTMESSLAYLRALLCRAGIDEMRRDAQIAWRGLSPSSPYRATMVFTEAISYLLEGDIERADAMLAHSFDAAVHVRAQPLAAVVLAERCVVATQREDWREMRSLAERALAIVQDGHYDEYWTSALVYAWGARAALSRGDVDRAREFVTRAARLRPLLTYALPVVSVQALLELARAYLELTDAGGAEAVLRQVHDILQQRPDIGLLPRQADELRSKLEAVRGTPVGASSLSTAELRLLPLMSTHLSFPEIGQRLYLRQAR